MVAPTPLERRSLYRILLVAFGSSFLLFGPLVGRLYYLQCMRNEYYTVRARGLHSKSVKITPQRGSIYSSEGRPLATSTVRESAYYAPRYLRDHPNFAEGTSGRRRLVYSLAQILSLERETVERLLNSNRDTVLRRQLEPKVVEELLSLREELQLPRPTIYFVREGKRLYPNGQLASQVIGYTRPDEYGDNIGLSGAEVQFNNLIAGQYSEDRVLVNVARQALTPLEDEALLRATGDDVYLTINDSIQQYTEAALQRQVEKYEAQGGVCVVMEVGTGDILAMASYPTFDINARGTVPDSFRRNRCIVDSISPGSVMKVFTVAGLIERNRMSPYEMIDCRRGLMYIPGRRNPIRDSHPLDVVPVHKAFAESSNVAFVLLGLRMEKEEVYDQWRRFGFGQRTGIDLPGEGTGIMHPLARWTYQSRVSQAIGYEITVTPIQMAAAMAAIANNGLYVRPHILKEVRSAQGDRVERYDPRPIRKVCSPQTSQIVLSLMEEVVTSGTATRAAVPGYRVGGKTGTTVKDASDSEGRAYYASFLGVLPVDAPRVVIYTWIDEPNVKWGGSVAAPLFSEVAEHTMRILGVPPTEKIVRKTPRNAPLPSENPLVRKPSPAHLALPVMDGVGLRMPDLTGLTVREAAEALHRAGIDAQMTGWGVVVQQQPEPGRFLTNESRALVVFAPPSGTGDALTDYPTLLGSARTH